MIYDPRKHKWEFAMSYNFFNKNDLEIVEFKNANDAKVDNLAKDFNKKIKL